MFDNINILINGCDETTTLDFIEVLNDIVGLSENETGVSVTVGVNRDLLGESEEEFYREAKSS